MKRLFTFGCSFTNYKWPTWADIVGLEYDHYENWGRQGSGNHFILYSLIECITQNNITSDDTIAIMWTTVDREDRLVNGQWHGNGSMHNADVNKEFGDEFINKFIDMDSYQLTSLAVIDAVKRIVENLGCTWYAMSMHSLTKVHPYNQSTQMYEDAESSELFRQICSTYSKTLQSISPSFIDTVFNGNANLAKNVAIPQVIRSNLQILKDDWNATKGPSWPEFDEFVNDLTLDLPNDIRDEICNKYEFDINIKYILEGRVDKHPTPSEALEYLQQIKIFNLTEFQEKTALKWNELLLADVDFTFKEHRTRANRLGNQ